MSIGVPTLDTLIVVKIVDEVTLHVEPPEVGPETRGTTVETPATEP